MLRAFLSWVLRPSKGKVRPGGRTLRQIELAIRSFGQDARDQRVPEFEPLLESFARTISSLAHEREQIELHEVAAAVKSNRCPRCGPIERKLDPRQVGPVELEGKGEWFNYRCACGFIMFDRQEPTSRSATAN